MPNRELLNPKAYGSLTDAQSKLKELVRYALLAPSTINTQPWKFKILETGIEVYADKTRQLPVSDPVCRQMYISVGAAIANIAITAEALGLKFSLEHAHEIQVEKPVATFKFINLISETLDTATLNALINRHTNRSAFTEQRVPNEILENLKRTLGSDSVFLNWIEDEITKIKVRELVCNAIEQAFDNKAFGKELSHWVKPSLQSYKDGMPGYYLGLPKIVSFFLPFVIRYKNVSQMQKRSHKIMLEHAPVYGVLSAKEDGPTFWIKTGEVLERIAIELTKNQIKIGILTAPTEIGKNPEGLRKILGLRFRPQVFFRIGYSDSVPEFSPRRDLEEVLL